MDVAARNGDLSKMPNDEFLRKFRKYLVPDRVKATEKETRVGLQETLDHTSRRFFERPDFFDFLEDGQVFTMLTKAGSDGQTGLGNTNR